MSVLLSTMHPRGPLCILLCCPFLTTCQPALLSNTKWVLHSRPKGNFKASDLRMEIEEINPEELADDELLVKVHTLSIEAFYRTTFDEEAYHGSTDIGATVPALGIGEVLSSGSRKFKPGAMVQGMLGAQTIARVPVSGVQALARLPGTSRTDPLGRVGISGITAWVGITSVTRPPHKGETVVVSAAAGAVGSLAAQLAKVRGAKVIGIAGGPEQTTYLLETLKLDGAVDYKDTSNSVGEQLDELAPDGVDFFFDNVGGAALDAVLERIRRNGRIVICGGISQYGAEGNVNKGTVQGPKQYLKLAERGAQMIGFNVMFYLPAKLVAFLWQMLNLIWKRKIVMTETVVDGIDGFASAVEMMYTGQHIGKLLVEVSSA